MITVEEKAKEYSNSEGLYNEHGEILLYMGYLAGYKEVTRWRDPKEELPNIDESVIVKYRTAKNVEKYGIGKYFNLESETLGLSRVRQVERLSAGDR